MTSIKANSIREEMFSQGLTLLRKVGLISEGEFILSSYQVYPDRAGQTLQCVPKIHSNGQFGYSLAWVSLTYPGYADLMNLDRSQHIIALSFPQDLHNYLGQPVSYTRYFRYWIGYKLKDYSGCGLGPILPNEVLIISGTIVSLLVMYAFIKR